MSTSFQSPSSQPAGEGPLRILFANRTNCGRLGSGKLYGIETKPTEISYPDREQPKPWTPTDWRPAPLQHTAPTASLVYRGSTSGFWTRPSTLAMIVERGEQKVERGKRYRFITETHLGVRLCFELLGVDGGSQITPGFEVYDLESRPGAWTVFWAKDFKEEWEMRVSNPYFDSWADLSVQLVSYAKRAGVSSYQRLVFSVTGSVTEGAYASGEELDWLQDRELIGPSQVRVADGSFTLEPST